MKLYLSSYKFGNSIQSLANMISDNKRIAIIQNPLDAYSDLDGRKLSLQNDMDGLAEIGLIPEALGIRNYFTRNIELQQILSELGEVEILKVGQGDPETKEWKRLVEENHMDVP